MTLSSGKYTTMPKTKLSAEQVRHVAKLANLPLSEKEVRQFEEQLSETVDYIDSLNELDTENVPPTSQVTGKVNELREDKITPSLSQDEALKNGPKIHHGFFVSKIVWE